MTSKCRHLDLHTLTFGAINTRRYKIWGTYPLQSRYTKEKGIFPFLFVSHLNTTPRWRMRPPDKNITHHSLCTLGKFCLWFHCCFPSLCNFMLFCCLFSSWFLNRSYFWSLYFNLSFPVRVVFRILGRWGPGEHWKQTRCSHGRVLIEGPC